MAKETLSKEYETIEQVESLIGKESAVLLYFYSDNCAPCISLRPKVIEMVSEKFPNLSLGFVNAETYPEITARYGAFSFPTLITYFEGREFSRDSKYIAIPQLAESISRPYLMLFEN